MAKDISRHQPIIKNENIEQKNKKSSTKLLKKNKNNIQISNLLSIHVYVHVIFISYFKKVFKKINTMWKN